MYNQNNEAPKTLPWWTFSANEGLAVWILGFKTNSYKINALAVNLGDCQDFCHG